MVFGDIINSYPFAPLNPISGGFDGKNFMTLSYTTNRFYFIDRMTGALVTNFAMPPNCVGLCYAEGGKLLMTRQTDDHVLYCDILGNLIYDLGAVAGAVTIYDICIIGGSEYAIVDWRAPANGNIIIVKISPTPPTSIEVVRSWTVGHDGPFGVAFDGKDLYVGRYNAPRRIDQWDIYGNLIRQVTWINRPTGMAFDGKHLWVANDTTDRIYCVSVN